MNKDIIKIANAYGIENQLCIAQEELAELIQAISKYRREGNINTVKEEIADVMIMLEQIIYLLDIDFENVDKIIDWKLKRQLKRIERGESC